MSGSPNVSGYRSSARTSKDPAVKKLVKATLDAYVRLKLKHQITETDLRPIMAAARSRFFAVWDVGMALLLSLSAKHETAQRAVRGLATSRKVGERFRIIASLGDAPSLPFSPELIRAALRDKSNRVREQAGNAAVRLRMTELISELEACARAERNRKVKQTLGFQLAMLRDGWSTLEKTNLERQGSLSNAIHKSGRR